MNVVSKLSQYIATHGLGRTLLRAVFEATARLSLGRIRLRGYAFTLQSLRRTGAEPQKTFGSTRIELIDAQDPRLQLAPRPPSVLAARCASGSECRMAFVQGQFAGMHWISRHRHTEDEVRCTYVLEPAMSSVWDFDVHVEPAYRGSRVFQRLWTAAESELVLQGFDRTFSRIDMLNTPSLAAHRRMGAAVVGHAFFLSCGRWQLTAASIAPWLSLASPRAAGPLFRLSATPGRRRSAPDAAANRP